MVDLPSMDFVYSMAFLLFYLIIMIIAMKKKKKHNKKNNTKPTGPFNFFKSYIHTFHQMGKNEPV